MSLVPVRSWLDRVRGSYEASSGGGGGGLTSFVEVEVGGKSRLRSVTSGDLGSGGAGGSLKDSESEVEEAGSRS